MTVSSLQFLDLILAGLLLMLAIAALHSQNLRHSIISFIVFGLVTALVWARLKAPDVALAEATIGSGIAGALLLAALREYGSEHTAKAEGRRLNWLNLSVSYGVIALVLGVAWAFYDAQMSYTGHRLGSLVESELTNSGVGNPVTAVLLNFRAYDTLLELAVLSAALMGILVLGPERNAPSGDSPVITYLVAWLTPILIVVGGYVLWVGAYEPGGAFQAGALLTAAGIIIRLSGKSNAGLPKGVWLRLVAVSGCSVFLLAGFFPMLGGANLLQFPTDWAGALILTIEVFATLSIAASLLLAYLSGAPESWWVKKEHRHV